jgi:uncharacterized protein involved in exopolysaccharide biosynthesis
LKKQNNQTPEYRQLHLEEDEISIFEILTILLRYKWLIIILLLVSLLVGYLFTKITYKKEYESKGTILLDKPVFSEKQNSWQYQQYTRNIVRASYKSVIYANETLRKILTTDIVTVSDGRQIKTNLFKMLDIGDVSTAVNYLKNIIKLNFDSKTYILGIATKTKNPAASKFIIDELITQLNLFYNKQIDITSKNEINNLKISISNAKNELEKARDNELKLRQNNKLLSDYKFKTRNDLPPKLKIEEERVSEMVKEKKRLYETIVKKYDDLRYGSIENVSLVTIIESPETSLNPIPVNNKKNILIAAFGGIMLSMLIIFVMEFIKMFKNKAKCKITEY